MMLRSGDIDFLMAEHRTALAWVEMGELAATKSELQALKVFASKSANQSRHDLARLKELAQPKLMTFPDVMSSKDYSNLAKLKTLSGAAFDKAYSGLMVKMLKQAVKRFRKEAKSGKDASIRAYAADGLPQLSEQLKQIVFIHKDVSSKKSD
jgi:putative membrane protein